jgi:hypothetical protein
MNTINKKTAHLKTAFVIVTQNKHRESQWKSELQTLTQSMPAVFSGFQAVLVDTEHPDWKTVLEQMDTSQKWVMLVTHENDFLPDARDLDWADDILVYPFRLAEMVSKVKHAQTHQQIHELKREVEFTSHEAKESLEILERMLASRTPKRFEGIRGLNIMSRHLTGLKPGGDYFDVFESQKKEQINILLCDSSSYGLSSALLGMILSSSAKIASDAQMNTADWIRVIYQELKITLGEKEHLSIFYGRLNRRDFSLQYQLFGSIEAFLVEKQSGDCHALEKSGGRLHQHLAPSEAFERKIHLNPQDRLVLLTDGFVKGVGGEFTLHQLFKNKIQKEPFQLVSELAFQIKSKLVPGETFPGEDCSAIVIDVEPRVLRLAPVG